MRGALGAALLAAALVGCTVRAPAHDRLSLGACRDVLVSQLAEFAPAVAGRVEVSCGHLDTPLDHARTDGEVISLPVVRVRHKEQSDRIGTLVFHPGGPGQSGVDYLPYLLGWFPEPLLRRFDLVTLDPRGTGGPSAFNCPAVVEEPGAVAPDVRTATGFARAVAAERRWSSHCVGTLGDRAQYFTSTAAARDVDLLRAAVGEERLTLIGASYGAKVGAEYAHRFPGSVRAVVLDAPAEPGMTVAASILAQTAGFEESFAEYAKGCARRPDCRLGDPAAFVARLVEVADRHPIYSRRAHDRSPATGADVLQAVRSALYDERRWVDLDEILWETSELGNSGGIFAMIEAGSGPVVPDSAPVDSSDVLYVVNCNDSAPGPTHAQIRTAAEAMERDFPVFGAHDAWHLLACRTWPAPRTVLERPVAATSVPVLVVGTVHDPATPYVGAVAMTTALGHARLLTWEGNSHTALAFSSCIADAVTAYLVDLVLPPEGTRCPS